MQVYLRYAENFRNSESLWNSLRSLQGERVSSTSCIQVRIGLELDFRLKIGGPPFESLLHSDLNKFRNLFGIQLLRWLPQSAAGEFFLESKKIN